MKSIALLGGGIFAREAHLPALAALLKKGPIPQLKAVYSRSATTGQAIAKAASDLLKSEIPTVYHDGDPSNNLSALLARSDIEAVIVVLPITTQPGIILQSLKAGKHVLSEKPIAPTVEEGLSLIKAYEEQFKAKGLVWSIAENFECEQAFRHVREVIRNGEIGKISFFNARVVNYVDETSKYYKTPWRTVPDYQGGFLLDGGVHTLAAVRVMLGTELTHVAAFASLNKEILSPHDTIQAIVRTEDSHGSIDMTFALPAEPKPNFDAFTLTGTKGWISVNQITLDDPQGKRPGYQIKTVISGAKSVTVVDYPSTGVETELAEFFSGVPSGWGTPRAALKDVAFIQAALSSKGVLVELASLGV